ncbi:hypothetical protein KCP74_24555 [Salmonella enterica subsp. enterica]|nr:hypothetical protein KCP74_24555 [Salmonella enterica subsp. enterica]
MRDGRGDYAIAGRSEARRRARISPSAKYAMSADVCLHMVTHEFSRQKGRLKLL